MASNRKVALVTGSNKGVGFAVVRALCKSYDGDVFLTSRDVGRGQAAIADLNKEGLQPKFHQLDISDRSSIERLKSFLQFTYGGLDVLVNNAGIAYQEDDPASFSERAEVTCKTNFSATLDVCRVLFPLLRPHARVVNVSSLVSQSAITRCSPAVQGRLKDPGLTMGSLEKIMQEFVYAAKAGTHRDQGFANIPYGMSKIGVTAMSFIQDRDIRKDSREDIVINACSPGRVATDMTSNKGTKTIDEGADTLVYLALLPPNTTSPRGNLVADRRIQNWG
ncbi:carbonyl reductase [NADPH] 3-like [Haliotis rufescens]|uniref:carbonyl reductase [NADPH] 3-like n=1 Tax=Haliotis rufescens TaxID=6454 RepID=UPI00201FAD77|nr:carbonyl reductase [NADPH] 3-like [Haliotis rufescens]